MEEVNGLLLKRREMMASQDNIRLIYKNQQPLTTSGVVGDGIQLFNIPVGFTILLDVTCNHYGWTTTQSVLSLGTTNNFFRIGRISSGKEYTNGVVTTQSVNRYFALIANETSGGKSMFSMYARGSNTSTTKKIAISYSVATGRVAAAYNSRNSVNWYNLTSNPVTDLTLMCWQNSGSGTINDLQIYQGVMSDEELVAYIHS